VGCGEPSIQKAAIDGNIEAVKRHLAAGTDLNAKGVDSWISLHFASIFGHKEIVELLCKQGGKTGVELKAEGKWNE